MSSSYTQKLNAENAFQRVSGAMAMAMALAMAVESTVISDIDAAPIRSAATEDKTIGVAADDGGVISSGKAYNPAERDWVTS